MLPGHMPPCVYAYCLSRPLAHQQKTERQRLRERGRKEVIEIGGVVASRFRMGIQHVPKFLSHLQKGMMRVASFVEFEQSVPHDPANEASGMSHQRREMFSVARGRFLSGACGKRIDQTQERSSVVFGNLTISARVVLVRAKGALRQHYRIAKFFATLKQTKLDKIAGCPAVKFFEPLKLAAILIAPARRIGGLCGRLKFDESPRGRPLPNERDVWPPDAWI